MADKAADSNSVVGVISKTISVTIKGRGNGAKDQAKSSGTGVADFSKIANLLSDKPLRRQKPRRLSRDN
jgi:hypothetical protein